MGSLSLSFSLGYQYPAPPENEISAGDAVVARVDPDVFKFAQEDHGGWFDDMAEVNSPQLAYIASRVLTFSLLFCFRAVHWPGGCGQEYLLEQ